MKKNLFWPIYQKIENEFKDLSYFISIDNNQLDVYSIKIADLILRTVSESECIAKELCKKNNIEFKNSDGAISDKVIFQEYIEKLDSVYNMKKKLVSFEFNNSSHDTFTEKLMPFNMQSDESDDKSESALSWYESYNNIRHDRIAHLPEANLKNLIYAMSALFLLNIYYLDEVFYSIKDDNLDMILNKIDSFSDVFSIDYSVTIDEEYKDKHFKNTFFNPYRFFEFAKKHAVYIIEYDKLIKTDKDNGADFLHKLESSSMIADGEGGFNRKHKLYKIDNHKTQCAVVAYIQKND